MEEKWTGVRKKKEDDDERWSDELFESYWEPKYVYNIEEDEDKNIKRKYILMDDIPEKRKLVYDNNRHRGTLAITRLELKGEIVKEVITNYVDMNVWEKWIRKNKIGM